MPIAISIILLSEFCWHWIPKIKQNNITTYIRNLYYFVFFFLFYVINFCFVYNKYSKVAKYWIMVFFWWLRVFNFLSEKSNGLLASFWCLVVRRRINRDGFVIFRDKTYRKFHIEVNYLTINFLHWHLCSGRLRSFDKFSHFAIAQTKRKDKWWLWTIESWAKSTFNLLRSSFLERITVYLIAFINSFSVFVLKG